MLFAYFSPEVTLPVVTALAAAFGFIIMVCGAPFRLAAKVIRAALTGRKPSTDAGDPTRRDVAPDATESHADSHG